MIVKSQEFKINAPKIKKGCIVKNENGTLENDINN